jgi:septum site-determining protein MinC
MDIKTENKIKIKGYQDGLIITTNHLEWKDCQDEIINQISEKENFFRGGKITLDVGDLIVRAAEMGSIRDKLSDKGVTLWSVISNSPTTIQTAQMLGLDTPIQPGKSNQEERKQSPHAIGDSALLIQRTLRSGISIQSDDNIVVIGDVNPGAELLSGKNILVWGRLRGAVQAGLSGDSDSVICAMVLTPTLLRIGEVVADLSTKMKKSKPYKAILKDGVIHFEPWD